MSKDVSTGAVTPTDGAGSNTEGASAQVTTQSTPNQDTSSSPAPGSLEALRAELGLGKATIASKDTPATASATAVGDVSSKSDTSKPGPSSEQQGTESSSEASKPPEAKPEASDDSEYASRVSRLARLDRESKQRLAEAVKKEEATTAKEKELHGAAADAQARKEARELFAAGKRREAILRGLGLEAIPEDLFADLASDAADKPLGKSDVDSIVAQRVKEALEAQSKAAEDKAKAEESERAKVIEDYESEQIEVAAGVFETEEKLWPLLHRLAAKGEQEQEYITAKYVNTLRKLAGESKPYSPKDVFDLLEKDYSDLVGPSKPPESKTISEETKRGSVPSPAPTPKTTEERWKQRELDRDASLAAKAKERGLRWE